MDTIELYIGLLPLQQVFPIVSLVGLFFLMGKTMLDIFIEDRIYIINTTGFFMVIDIVLLILINIKY